MKKSKTEYLCTSDLALCATLYCLGYPIEKTEKDGQRVNFLIRRDKDLEINIKMFWAHELKVDPLSYFNSLKEIKTRIYSF